MTFKAKFQLKDIVAIGLTLVVAGIGISYGIEALGDVREDQCAYTLDDADCRTCPALYTYNASGNECYNATGTTTTYTGVYSEAWNASTNSLTGTAKIPEKMPLIATVVIAAIVIGILIRYLAAEYM